MHNNSHYAKTLFDVCSKSNCTSKIQSELKLIEYLYTKTPAFRLVIITKRLSNQNKINIIKNTLTQFDSLVVEFLSIIIANNQSNHLLDIILRFNRFVSMHSDIKEVELTTASKLDDFTLRSLTNSLHNNLSSQPKIKENINPEIIGGIKLRIGNKIFDNSVSYQIKQLKKTLHNM